MEWLNTKDGHLTIIIGNMFSGKTTLLRETLAKFIPLGISVCYLNSIMDKRETSGTNNKFSTHNSLNLSTDDISEFKVSSLSEFDKLSEFDVIGIDESHFFGEELVPVVKEWVNIHNIFNPPINL